MRTTGKRKADCDGEPPTNQLPVYGDEILVIEERAAPGETTSSEAQRKGKSVRPNQAQEVVDLTKDLDARRSEYEERLARLQRENRELKRKRDGIPDYWREMAEGERFNLIDLPLPDDICQEHLPVDEESLKANGITRSEILTALRECNGVPADAFALIAMRRDKCASTGAREQPSTSQENGRRRRRKTEIEQEEGQHVVNLFHLGGLARDAILKVQRVQNPHLWRKYVERRQEVVRHVKGDSEELPEVVDSDQAQLFRSTSEKESLNSNERFLFHGAGIESIASIVESGFETRIANLQGALGAGSYFARDSWYSVQYTGSCSRADTEYLRGKSKCPVDKVLSFPGKSSSVLLLCRVALGRVTRGQIQMRIPPDGYTSAGDMAGRGGKSSIFCIFDNPQAYPEYLVYFDNSKISPKQPPPKNAQPPGRYPNHIAQAGRNSKPNVPPHSQRQQQRNQQQQQQSNQNPAPRTSQRQRRGRARPPRSR